MTANEIAVIDIEIDVEELEQKVAPSGSLWPF